MKKLSSATIRLLSSSQVVTSVSSAVKELVENALDAGATSLDVKLEKWGLDKIEVRDNGFGIRRSDTCFMAQRHYTSKITKHDDLESLGTYGFRGEALGSLCQIADVCVTTKTDEDPLAICYTLDHDGKIRSEKPCHDGTGTTVVATNLFKNLPVRKQFYNNVKKSKDELKRIEDILIAYGLIIPEVRITLRNNKTVIWQKNKSCDVRTALTDVFGFQTFSQLDCLEYVDNTLPITLKCFLPKTSSNPQLTWRSSDDRCFIFVNKRYVEWKELIQVLKKHCVSCSGTESISGKFPLCFISLDLSSKDIDVNLEPNKTRVLIKNKEEVLEVVSKKLFEIYKTDSSCSMPPTNVSCVTETQEENGNGHISSGTCSVDARTDQNRLIRMGSRSGRACAKSGRLGHEKRGLNINVEEHEDVLTEKVHATQESNVSEGAGSRDRAVDMLHNDGHSDIPLDQCSLGGEKEQAGLDVGHDGLHQSEVDNDKSSASKEKRAVDIDECSRQRNGAMNDINIASTPNSSADTNKNCSSNQSSLNNGTARGDERLDTRTSCSRDGQSELDELLQDLDDDLDVLDGDILTTVTGSVQPTVDQWSKGRGLCDKSGKDVEPLRLVLPEMRTNKSESNGKRKHSLDKDSPSLHKSGLARKRTKKFAKVSGQPSLTSVLQSPKTPKPVKPRTATKQVSFSLSLLKQLASNRQSLPTATEEVNLIKRLDPWGVWLIRKNRELFILNPFRIQEVLLYKRLLATHVIPREKLEKAIILDERILGGARRYDLLEKLTTSKRDSENMRYCDDERLVSNGFEVCRKWDLENGKTRLELFKINTTIPYFGVRDLMEVLDLMQENENACFSRENSRSDLARCRPSKVCNFLKDEVVRVSRGLTSRTSEADVVDLLTNMKNELTDGEDRCIHDVPFLYSLTTY